MDRRTNTTRSRSFACARLASSSSRSHKLEDYPAIEADYARRTGIFPIMHLVGIRREFAEREPGLCLRVCNAFEAARRYAIERTKEAQAPFTSLPWGPAELGRAESILGEDFWSYGVDANRSAIDALCRYSFNQGIAPRLLKPEELFASETLAWNGVATRTS
jgi:4,5-dihydroxyphthalate decarboxylase